MFFRNTKRKEIKDILSFEIESLEQRQMLSAVDIFAAGSTNEETLQLKIADVVVRTWTNVGGNAEAGEFQMLSYSAEGQVDPGQIKIEFVNDLYEPENGIDRNLRIDRIEVDGKTFEAEDPSVFSTGTWLPEDGVTPGFRESEYLHSNGYIQFAIAGHPPRA